MDILIDSVTGDGSITDGDLDTVDGLDAAVQRAADVLQTFKGEWFLDLDFGVDYIKDVLKKAPNLTLVRSILAAEINKAIGDDAVLSQLEVVLVNSTRKLDVSFVLRNPTDATTVQRTVVIG